ncbi:hypothetical protein [Ureibacillus sinduriensis]|uniref:Uncharacterized protein n=1 Tax=Ureibacillus sinduriensis BLB-1 = JCM 15800 TaxID=1384057 RepID=A0A0A3I3S1_9BACL|nr:hypothetical protein [Ureibacillus sinduriensis]KGR79451.1 hypothetical protein CD33_00460 [Ureibacillus sinduriensis BLB-1 = JCM 15800]
MTHHNEGELKMVIQLLLGIFIAFVCVRFLYVISSNYSPAYVIAISLGFLFLYFPMRNIREFDTFANTVTGMSIVFSFIYLAN